jgi:hypothetical protein
VLYLYRCVLKRASAAVLLRTIGFASASAIMAGASTAGAFDDRRPKCGRFASKERAS